MQSTWFLIAQAFTGQVQGLAATLAAGFLDNPPLPLDAGAQPEKLLFVLQRGDKLTDQPGQRREQRRMRMVLGALARTKDGAAAADALHFAARDLLKGAAARVALNAAGVVGPVREVELEPELKDVATQGALLMSAYEIDYYQQYPNAA
jgi:hypothetical protein